jgi:hypothetical protein
MIFKEIDNIRDVGVICHYLYCLYNNLFQSNRPTDNNKSKHWT